MQIFSPMFKVPAFDRSDCISSRDRLSQAAASPWIRKSKVKLLLYAITTTWILCGSGGLAPPILNFCTRCWVIGLTLGPPFLCGIFSTIWKRLVWRQVVQTMRQNGNLCLVWNKTQTPHSSTARSSQYINISRFHNGQIQSSNLVQANNPVIWFSFLCYSSRQSQEVKNRPRPLSSTFLSISRLKNQRNTFHSTTRNLNSR
jgi:hypothetical protein